MAYLILYARAARQVLLLVIVAQAAQAQSVRPVRSWAAPEGKPRFIKAFVVDDRISVIRREADIKGRVIQRLREGRRVYVLESKKRANGAIFYRVAVTRRTRGWIHEAALAIPQRPGEDKQVIGLIANAESLDRLILCRLFLEHFTRSPLAARALLELAQEAERAAVALAPRARRRLATLDARTARASLRDYYLSDPGIDRYSRLNIRFDFDEKTGEYVYDGHAYRELVRLFPQSGEAQQAREWLDRVDKKISGAAHP